MTSIQPTVRVATTTPASTTAPSTQAPVLTTKPVSSSLADQAKIQLGAMGQAIATIDMLATIKNRPNRPEFKKPDDYRNYVMQLAGYLESAQKNLTEARQKLTEEQQKFQGTENLLKQALQDAQGNLAKTRTLYQAPVTQWESKVEPAQKVLYYATYPKMKEAEAVKTQADALGTTVSHLEGKLAAAKQNLQNTKNDTVQTQNSRAANVTRLGELKEEVKRLSELVPTESNYRQAQENVENAADNLRSAGQARDYAQGRVNRRRDVIQDLDANRGVPKILRGLAEEADVAERDIRDQRDKVAKAQSDERRIREEVRVHPQRDKLENIIESTFTKVKEAETAVKKLKDKAEKRDELQSSRNDYQSKVGKLEKQKANAETSEKAIAEAKAKVKEREEILARAERTNEEQLTKPAQEQLDAAQNALKELEGKVVKFEEKDQTTMTQYKSQVAQLTESLKAYDSIDDDIKKASDHAANVRRPYNEAKEDLASFEDMQAKRIKNAQQDVGHAQSQLKRAQEILNKIDNEMRRYGANVNNVDQVIRDRSNAIQRWESELQGLHGVENQLSQAISRVRDAQDNLDQARSTYQKMTNLRHQLSETKGDQAETEQAIATASQRFSANQIRVAQLEKEIQTLPPQIKQNQTQQQAKLDAYSKLASVQNPATHPSVAKAQSDLEAVKKNLDAARQAFTTEVDKANAQVAVAQGELGNFSTGRGKLLEEDAKIRNGESSLTDGKREMADTSKALNAWTKGKWKLMNKFDVDKFWQDPKLSKWVK